MDSCLRRAEGQRRRPPSRARGPAPHRPAPVQRDLPWILARPPSLLSSRSVPPPPATVSFPNDGPPPATPPFPAAGHRWATVSSVDSGTCCVVATFDPCCVGGVPPCCCCGAAAWRCAHGSRRGGCAPPCACEAGREARGCPQGLGTGARGHAGSARACTCACMPRRCHLIGETHLQTPDAAKILTQAAATHLLARPSSSPRLRSPPLPPSSALRWRCTLSSRSRRAAFACLFSSSRLTCSALSRACQE